MVVKKKGKTPKSNQLQILKLIILLKQLIISPWLHLWFVSQNLLHVFSWICFSSPPTFLPMLDISISDRSFCIVAFSVEELSIFLECCDSCLPVFPRNSWIWTSPNSLIFSRKLLVIGMLCEPQFIHSSILFRSSWETGYYITQNGSYCFH